MDRELYYQKLRDAGHELITDEEGVVDIFAHEYDNHNGPACKLCGEGWCHHCQPEPLPCPAKESIGLTYV